MFLICLDVSSSQFLYRIPYMGHGHDKSKSFRYPTRVYQFLAQPPLGLLMTPMHFNVEGDFTVWLQIKMSTAYM